jgi:hypothetical protein
MNRWAVKWGDCLIDGFDGDGRRTWRGGVCPLKVRRVIKRKEEKKRKKGNKKEKRQHPDNLVQGSKWQGSPS